MGGFKNLLDFYIDASIHVAAAVTALTWITFWEFDIQTDFTILFFNFFATITGYNFVKYFGLAKFHHRSLAKWLRTIQIFSAICFVILAYLTFQLPIRTILYLAVLGVITFLYAIPFLPSEYFLDGNKNLRSISGLKIYLIALIWGIVTVVIPLINNNVTIGPDAFITGVQRFLIVLV
ncbi:MAG: hypothetical protein R3213_09785, partial [Flavobacteriaceae bacterium]|nr:hypothetical protein [Flavobacteriaceae bacterium]